QITLVAEGEVVQDAIGMLDVPQTYFMTLRLEGSPDQLEISLTSPRGMSEMELLTLLMTGRTMQELQSGGEGNGRSADAALAFAGSRLTTPVSQFLESQLERRLNL